MPDDKRMILKAEVPGDVLFALVRDYVMRAKLGPERLRKIVGSPDGQFITRIEMHRSDSNNITDMHAIVEVHVPKDSSKRS